MRYVTYGGILRYDDLLGGFLKYGVLGEHVFPAVEPGVEPIRPVPDFGAYITDPEPVRTGTRVESPGKPKFIGRSGFPKSPGSPRGPRKR